MKVSLRAKIIFVISILFFTTVILEIGLRVAGGVVLSLQEYQNQQRIRQRPAYRIMCLGESTTAGQYPPFLQKILDSKNMETKFSVIDKGVPGANTSAILENLEKNIQKYKPDMVIVMMGINDFGKHIPYPSGIVSDSLSFLESLRVYRLFRLLWVHGVRRFKNSSLMQKPEVLQPDEGCVYVKKGESYQIKGKFDQAERYFKKAIISTPENERAYAKLGWFYRIQGDFPKAEKLFEKAMLLNPENDLIYIRPGWLHRRDKFIEAEEAFKRLTKDAPENDWAYVELGAVYRESGKFDQAERYFKKAISLNLENQWAIYELGSLYLDYGKLDQAKSLFEQVSTLYPDNDWVYSGLATVYLRLGKRGLAAKAKKKAEELRLNYYLPATIRNYNRLKDILDREGILLVAVQYPMRSLAPLKRIFENNKENIAFVDNERVFKEAVNQGQYTDYFTDYFAGDFGHCTDKGNMLLAENIARVILKDIFGK